VRVQCALARIQEQVGQTHVNAVGGQVRDAGVLECRSVDGR
jgi:hypothetical protein